MATLQEAIASNNDPETMQLIEAKLADGESAESIIGQCNEAMIDLGERFDKGEAFIPDLMIGGLIMKKVMARLEPEIMSGGKEQAAKKTFVIGTVKHDVHDIGKDITAMVFRSSGFNVIDLGVDVPPQKFVEAIEKHKPEILGMSLLLTTSYKSVTETMEAICNSGMREKVKICVGGAAASPLMTEKLGIDFYAKTAVSGLRWALEMT
ncbi:MAG: cobalamin-dependent protein [Planctomycetaceae bacterium]|nr:cobalamin-dependent protein [Planctomycetaceae bacterium]